MEASALASAETTADATGFPETVACVVGGPGAVPLRGNQRPGVVTTLHATRVLSFAPAVGKPYEGEPHVRFDEGAAETGRWSARPGHSPERGETARGRRTCDGTAPLPHSTPPERARANLEFRGDSPDITDGTASSGSVREMC